MAYEKKDGDITLFTNNKTNDNQPDMRGSIHIKGKDYEVALWTKQGKNGLFYSGRVGKEVQLRKNETKNPTFAKPQSVPKATSAFDDEIPWK